MKESVGIITLPTKDVTDIIVPIRGVGKGIMHLKEYYGNACLNMGDEYHHAYVTVSQDVDTIKRGDWIIHEVLKSYVKSGMLIGKVRHVDHFTAYVSHWVNDTSHYQDYPPQSHFTSCRKIIATTNINLTIPQVQQSFLKELVASPKGEFEVEYTKEYVDTKTGNKILYFGFEFDDAVDRGDVIPEVSFDLQLNQDNTVNITSVEKERGVTIINLKEKNINKLLKDRRNHLNSELSDLNKVKLTKTGGSLGKIKLEERISELDWIKENL
jgi:hypothetical protein